MRKESNKNIVEFPQIQYVIHGVLEWKTMPEATEL